MTRSNRLSSVIIAVKISVGLSLVAWVLAANDNAATVLALLFELDSRYLSIVLVIGLALRVVSAAKWSLFVNVQGPAIGYLPLLGLYLIGQFVNNFVPSMIGGDIVRAFMLGRRLKSHSRSLASIYLERMTGFSVLVVLAVAMSFINFNLFLRSPRVFLLIICLATVVVLTGWAAVLLDWPMLFLRRFAANRIAASLRGRIQPFHDAVISQGIDRRVFSLAVCYSFLFYFLIILSVYFSAVAVGLKLNFLDIAFVTPLLFLAASVPVSPNNIGWWEWAFSFLFASIGEDFAAGLTVALVMRGTSLLLSLTGGVLLLFWRAQAPSLEHR